MIRIVPTGDLGLDLLLGGGWRLIQRLGERSSATVLVRGGAGAGKTLVGLQAALALAKELGGDVAVGCVEILPTEYFAQVLSARPDIPKASIVTLPGATEHHATTRLFCGLLTDLDANEPDLVASLEALARDVVSAGGKPVVFIVDSLIEGYGIGASATRTSADALMKFAAHGGVGLVLCEESQGGAASPWQFAADTVIELGVEARERGRWIEVRKHRFGASVSGRHELDLGRKGAPAVYPEPHAWVTPHRQGVLQAHGWEFGDSQSVPQLVWHEALQLPRLPIEGAFVLVTGSDAPLTRVMSAALIASGNDPRRTLVIELDPLVLREEEASDALMDVHYVPTVLGAARALRGIVERFARVFRHGSQGQHVLIQRVLLGNLGLVLEAPDALEWVEVVRVLASLVIESGAGVPVIAYAAGHNETPSASLLATLPDAHIRMYGISAAGTERWRRREIGMNWPALPSLPEGFYELPRPRGRQIDRG